MNKRLPLGIEDFKEMIDENYYYVDKTDFIKDTFNRKVALYTRPRRFGKTLNMSMLQYFYSIKESQNAYLFQDLNIMAFPDSAAFQNQYPVIFISLKDMTDDTIDLSLSRFSSLIQMTALNFPELKDSKNLPDEYKAKLQDLRNGTTDYIQLTEGLRFLSQCLFLHYSKKVILLIDEYDVPLNTAFECGYHQEMTRFIRSVFSNVLKTNPALEKAILTGCLRISKESIFTGLNNFSVNSIMNIESSSAFGFTQEEVNSLYSRYGFSNKLSLVRDWYDGYQFGPTDIYNPWSVLQYLSDLLANPDAAPVSYWANTSSNSIVMNYLKTASPGTKSELEQLMNGHSIIKTIKPDLTFNEMENPENIYSFLLLTGYLKSVSKVSQNRYELMIPNKEVQEIYATHFHEQFKRLTRKMQQPLYDGLLSGNTIQIQDSLNFLLAQSISFFDNIESFYHGFLLGVLSDYGFSITSNREAGNGRPDLIIASSGSSDNLLIIECKHSKNQKDLEEDALKAIHQIQEQRYLEDSAFDDFEHKLGYGISFHKKKCMVRML